jgi:excisionase family DNA binding protein
MTSLATRENQIQTFVMVATGVTLAGLAWQFVAVVAAILVMAIAFRLVGITGTGDRKASTGMPAGADALVSAKHVAEYLSVSTDSVTELAREGKIPVAAKVGKQYRFRLSDVVAALSRQKHEG